MGSLRNIRPSSPVHADGEDVVLTFVGLATTWESGTPTINPSTGSLGAITVDSDVHAHATYTPPATAQTVTFTDVTDGGTTATLAVTDAAPVYGQAPEVNASALAAHPYQGHLVTENP